MPGVGPAEPGSIPRDVPGENQTKEPGRTWERLQVARRAGLAIPSGRDGAGTAEVAGPVSVSPGSAAGAARAAGTGAPGDGVGTGKNVWGRCWTAPKCRRGMPGGAGRCFQRPRASPSAAGHPSAASRSRKDRLDWAGDGVFYTDTHLKSPDLCLVLQQRGRFLCWQRYLGCTRRAARGSHWDLTFIYTGVSFNLF